MASHSQASSKQASQSGAQSRQRTRPCQLSPNPSDLLTGPHNLDELEKGLAKITFAQSPRRSANLDLPHTNQTDLRPHIAAKMNKETIVCRSETFLKHLLDFTPSERVIDVALKKSRELWPKKAPTRHDKEQEYFARVGLVVSAIGKIAGVRPRRKRNAYVWKHCPSTVIESGTKGVNCRMDACLRMEVEEKNRPWYCTDVIVPMEFKVTHNWEPVKDNREKIMSDAHLIMGSDRRRDFIYGVAIEGTRFTLWYFSRAFTCKALSFDWFTPPGRRTFAQVFLSLFWLTPEELGLNPRITLTKERQFIFEFPSVANPPAAPQKARYFLSVKVIKASRDRRLSGRATFIDQVVEVHSPENPTAISDIQYVLKDCWILDDSLTEGEIQRQLFASLDDIVSTDRNAHEVASTIAEHQNTRLSSILDKGSFRDLFLCIHAHHTCPSSKRRPPGAWKSVEVFLPQCEPPEVDIWTPSAHIRQQSSTRNHSKAGAAARGSRTKQEHRLYPPRRRCFILFDQICTPIHELPTMKDVVDVAKQCADALFLMFLAGWVHRDISVGNILAVRADDGTWKVKLADLEYAKKFPSETGSPEPKTGTPFFMATEILQSRYIGQEVRSASHADYRPFDLSALYETSPDEKDPPVIHNFQHDLESLFWVLLWISLTCVGHKPSEKYSWELFVPQMRLSNARRDAFVNQSGLADLPGFLHSDLNCIVPHIRALKKALYQGSVWLTVNEGWFVAKSYHDIHSLFSDVLQKFHEECGMLQEVKLISLDNDPSKMRTREFRSKIDLDHAESTSMIEQDQVQSASMDCTESLSVGPKRRIDDADNGDRTTKRPRQTRAQSHSGDSETDGDVTRSRCIRPDSRSKSRFRAESQSLSQPRPRKPNNNMSRSRAELQSLSQPRPRKPNNNMPPPPIPDPSILRRPQTHSRRASRTNAITNS